MANNLIRAEEGIKQNALKMKSFLVHVPQHPLLSLFNHALRVRLQLWARRAQISLQLVPNEANGDCYR